MFHETLEEQLSRVDLMVSEDSKSNLSEYERDALRAVILELRIISHAFLALKEKEDATQQSYERVSELAENLTATLRAIRDANYREWEELATFVCACVWRQTSRDTTCAHCSCDMSKQKTHERCSHGGLCESITDYDQRTLSAMKQSLAQPFNGFEPPSSSNVQ